MWQPSRPRPLHVRGVRRSILRSAPRSTRSVRGCCCQLESEKKLTPSERCTTAPIAWMPAGAVMPENE